eukprot:scaffold123697_cov21-Tisochrysis_lutea.AAC.1
MRRMTVDSRDFTSPAKLFATFGCMNESGASVSAYSHGASLQHDGFPEPTRKACMGWAFSQSQPAAMPPSPPAIFSPTCIVPTALQAKCNGNQYLHITAICILALQMWNQSGMVLGLGRLLTT